MTILRGYQRDLKAEIYGAWVGGAHTVMAISATGSGKTVLFSNILAEERGASCAIAHRRELVSQMSLALARNGVRHRVVGSKDLIRQIVGIHTLELGASFYDPSARCGVIGIDALPGMSLTDPWLGQVQLWIGDEGHHFLRENKWGKGVAMFPNARGLLVTATGFRADGQGLGRHADGIADTLVEGPSMRWLIDNGYLTDYRVIAPPSDVDYSNVPITASGDLSPQKLREAVHKSTRIIGDVVKHYKKFAAGKLAVCFNVDVAAAEEQVKAFQAAGIKAEVITANTPDGLRQNILMRFRRREIMVLCNVDLFGEGFDLPAIECVIMVRKTESKCLFDQQFGRALRILVDAKEMAIWDSLSIAERKAHIVASGKTHGIIIDHVGNVERHLPPDSIRFHTLNRRDKRARKPPDDVVPIRTCLNVECMRTYERIYKRCPYCGTPPEIVSRGDPKYVDGDLEELSLEKLREMRGEIDRIDALPSISPYQTPMVQQAIKNNHFERQRAQADLRASIALWGGQQRDLGRSQSEQWRRFFFMFNIDVMSAQALGRKDAQELKARIDEKLALDRIVPAI
jgi:superfamily II DNA or RNA helicase